MGGISVDESGRRRREMTFHFLMIKAGWTNLHVNNNHPD
jgi:hypothetical protein